MSYFGALRGYTEDAAVDECRVDLATHTLQVMDYEHHEIHDGSMFFIRAWSDLSINQVLQFTWETPNTTEWAHFTWEISTESEYSWTVMENAVITSALSTTITPLNANRNSAHTSSGTLKYEIHANLAAANAKIDITGVTYMAAGIVGAGKTVGGTATRSTEIILKQNAIYAMRGEANAAGYINFFLQWYEHTNKT